MKPINVGIIGAGRIGKVHAEAIVYRLPQANAAVITDVSRPAAEAVAKALRIPRVAANAEEIFADSSIDAVLICSSTDTHPQMITAAAKAGKHIFCEKPLAHTLEQIDAALAEVEKAKVKLQTGFNRRFDPNFMRVRRAITSGEIGEPHIIHIISRDPAPPPIAYIKVSGGMFLDMMIHDLDQARFLIGDEVEEVYTKAACRVDEEIEKAGDIDTAVVMLTYRNGVIGTIDNSRKAAFGYDQRVEVFGSKGAISTGNFYANQATISTAESIHRDLPLDFFMTRYTESFANEIAAFVDAVVNDKPVPVSGLDGRVPVAMAIAIKKSHLEGRPVKLSEIG